MEVYSLEDFWIDLFNRKEIVDSEESELRVV